MLNITALAGVCLALLAALSPGAAVAGVAPVPPHADIVRLATGEELTVEVLEQSTSQITFRHPILGTITLPASAVRDVTLGGAVARSSGGPVTARDASTDSAAAATAPDESAGVVVEAESEGALEEVAPGIRSGSSGASSGGSSEAHAENGGPVSSDDPPAREGGWNYRFTLAGTGSSGNTQAISFTTRLSAIRETEWLSTLIDGAYQFGSQDGDKSDNRATAGIRNDWLFPGKRHFYFADGRYDYDEFQSWLHRVSGHLGVGYRLVEGPPLVMSGRVGLGALKEWKSENEGLRPEALVGVEGVWDVGIDQAIRFSSTYFPDLADATTFRWVNSAGWTWRIAKDSALSLSAGIEHEYQSKVDPGQDRNDIRVFAGVDLEF